MKEIGFEILDEETLRDFEIAGSSSVGQLAIWACSVMQLFFTPSLNSTITQMLTTGGFENVAQIH